MRRRTSSLILSLSLLVAACDAAVDPIIPGTSAAATGDAQVAIVGTVLPTPVTLVVKDTKGRPMKNTTVTFAVTSGGGSLATPAVTTSVDGVATAGAWTLGTKVGLNSLTATVDGISVPVVFNATATAAAAASVNVVTGNGQTATVNSVLGVTPTVVVKDAFDNPIQSANVSFAVTSGGGAVASTNATTDANGIARVPDWTLGKVAGANTMTASVSGVAPTVILAKATAANAYSLELKNSTLVAGKVASALTPTPAVIVRDLFGNVVSGTAVTFVAATGSGQVGGANKTTDSLGVAAADSWTLGTTAGAQTLIASVNSIAPLYINVTAAAAAASQVAISAGNNQSAQVGTKVANVPTVMVQDAYGNAVSGTSVTFAVATGGGAVGNASATTNVTGAASAGSWTLGATAGTNTMTASIGTATVTFTANATATPVTPVFNPGAYNISVKYVVPPTARQQLAVDRAIARWQQIITADLPDASVNAQAGECGALAVNENVDDLLLVVDFSDIDGPGKVLGQAGPCYIRSGSFLPALGALQLDAADLTAMETNGQIDDVVTHEIGHVLGIGSLWSYKGMMRNAGTDSTTFTGTRAGSAFTLLGGAASYAGVPVENCVGIIGCGAGTKDVHWREKVMGRELMTGYISTSGNPLSRITIQSLADMGYTVNLNAADSYMVSASLRAGPADGEIEIAERKPDWIIRTVR